LAFALARIGKVSSPVVAWQHPVPLAGSNCKGETRMPFDLKPCRFRLTGALAVIAVTAGAALLLRVDPVWAQSAQGPMSAPACQCSAAVTIAGMGSRITHCICGVMACAITEPVDAASRASSMMQCVRQ
jgi:hypothetical protein